MADVASIGGERDDGHLSDLKTMTDTSFTEATDIESLGFTTHTLRRSGLRPMVIDGRCLVETCQEGPYKVHLKLLETRDGGYVACLSYARRPKSEILTHQAFRFDTADEAVGYLTEVRPGVSPGTLSSGVDPIGRESARQAHDSLAKSLEQYMSSYRRLLRVLVCGDRLDDVRP